jgi:hypothetical protein
MSAFRINRRSWLEKKSLDDRHQSLKRSTRLADSRVSSLTCTTEEAGIVIKIPDSICT